MALKLDMKTVYDRIEWGFSWQTLSKLGFHKKWIEWPRECVTTVLYLFIIYMEVLASRLYHQANLQKSGMGIKMSTHGLRLPCLFLAYDSLLLCKADRLLVIQLKVILALFLCIIGSAY